MQAGGSEGSVWPGKLVLLAASSYSQPEATGLRTVESDVPEGQVAAQTWRQARKKDRERERGLQSVERQTEREGEKERGRKIAAARLISFPGTPGLLLFDSGFSTIGSCISIPSYSPAEQGDEEPSRTAPTGSRNKSGQERQNREEDRRGRRRGGQRREKWRATERSGAERLAWLGLAFAGLPCYQREQSANFILSVAGLFLCGWGRGTDGTL